MSRSNLFASTACYYARYRPGYPQSFFDYLVETFRLDGTGTLLDLGCGTGQLALPLARRFSSVIALDPEPEMLEAGAALAAERGVDNIRWVAGSDRDVSSGMGPLRMVTIGRAFHWMDRETLLPTLYELLEDNAPLVLTAEETESFEPENWKAVVNGVVKEFLGEQRRAGDSVYVPPPERFEQTLSKSIFGGYEEVTFPEVRTWTVEQIIGHLFSTSFSSRRLLGDRADEFERVLRERLEEFNPSGEFFERVKVQALVSVRPPRGREAR